MGTWIASAIVAGVIGFAVWNLYKSQKSGNGCGNCGGNCCHNEKHGMNDSTNRNSNKISSCDI